jgi:hypothetical protein
VSKITSAKTVKDPTKAAIKALGNASRDGLHNMVPPKTEQELDMLLTEVLDTIAKGKFSMAYSFLLKLDQPAAQKPNDAQTWRLCECMMHVASYCTTPRMLVPLALKWIKAVHDAKNWVEYFRVVLLVITQLDPVLEHDEVVAITTEASNATETYNLHHLTGRIALTLNTATFHIKCGIWHRALHCFEVAQEQVDAGKEDYPIGMRIQIRLGTACCRRALGEYPAAMVILKKALVASPNKSAAGFAVGLEIIDMLMDMRQYELALESMQPMLSLLATESIPDKVMDASILRLYRMQEQAFQLVSRDRATIDPPSEWRMCNHCSVIEKDMKWCACHAAWYCNETCQHADWLAHKPSCVQCAGCGTIYPAMARCSRCKMVHYCSPECSKAHWPQHKVDCTLPPAPVLITVTTCKTCKTNIHVENPKPPPPPSVPPPLGPPPMVPGK